MKAWEEKESVPWREKVGTNFPLCFTAKYVHTFLNIVGREGKKPYHHTLLEKKVAYLECVWRNIVAFCDFHTWGKIAFTLKYNVHTNKSASKPVVLQLVELLQYSRTLLLPLQYTDMQLPTVSQSPVKEDSWWGDRMTVWVAQRLII